MDVLGFDVPMKKGLLVCPICGGARFWNEPYCCKECAAVGEYDDLEKHGVPARIAAKVEVSQSTLGSERMEELCRDLSGPKPGLFIFGNVGSGKSYTAAALLKAKFMAAKDSAAKARKAGNWKSGSIVAIPNAWTTPEAYCRAMFSGLNDIVNKWRKSPLLVLDDLGREISSDAMIGTITELVDYRIEGNKKTIITSNLSLSQIEASSAISGARLASRLAQFHIVRIDGKDRRLG